MNIFRRLYGYLRRYKTWASIAFGSMLFFAVAQTTMMALIRPLFDEVLVPPQSARARAMAPPVGSITAAPVAPANAAAKPATRDDSFKQKVLDAVLNRDRPAGHRGALINTIDAATTHLSDWWNGDRENRWKKVITLFLIVFVVRALASFSSEYAFQKVGLSTVRDLRNQLYESIINQSHRFFSERTTGEMVSRLVSDADAIQAAVSTRMGDLVQESVVLLALIVFVFISNPQLAFICLVVAPILIAPVVHFGRGLRKTTHRSQERMADITTILEETIRGVRIVKAFTMESFEIRRFRAATQKHLDWNLRAQKIQAVNSPIMELLAGSLMLALFLYARSRIANNTLSLGEFLSFLAALVAMYDPIKKLNKVNLSITMALTAAERVFRMLDIDNEVKERPDARVLTRVGSGVRFDDISFAYGDTPVLQHVTIEVAPGEIVALVGGSGAGKSTIVNLLPRFYDVDEGRIVIDGHDVRDLTLSSLRGLMGFVTQEVVLFNDSVRNNIAYGLESVDEARVIAAARAANAHEFIAALPNGYDTLIGESGVLLSGGQRQRLAIARALFKDPPILVLDEATSALDTESERLVQSALNNLMRGRTTLVIAHRLSTIRNANKIVVLEKGEVAEVGPHEELIARRGIYRKLYDMQFAEEDRPAGALA